MLLKMSRNLSISLQRASLAATPSEVTELHHRLHSPLSIVITGQDNYGKATILTKLLGVKLLPFAPSQHTCGDGTSQPPAEHLSPEQLPTDDADHQLSKGSASSTGNTSMHSHARLDTGNDKLWRGIRITHSATPNSFAVVRPESRASICPSEDEEGGETLAPPTAGIEGDLNSCQGGPSIPSLDGGGLSHEHPNQPPNSVMTSASPLPSDAGAEAQPGPARSPAGKPIYIGGMPVTADSITVAQLEELLETKLRTHLEDQKTQKTNPGAEAFVTEVKLSDLELKSCHLKDPILRDALLDVGLNHCLLREQVQIILTPSINKYSDMCCSSSYGGDTTAGSGSGVMHRSSGGAEHNVETSAGKDEVDNVSETSFCSMEVLPPAELPPHVTVTVPTTDYQPFKSGTTSTASRLHGSPLSAPATDVIPPASSTVSVAPVSASMPVPRDSGSGRNFLQTSSHTARSPSLLYGTPLSQSMHYPGEQDCPSISSSTSSSLNSLHSFKSLPIGSPPKLTSSHSPLCTPKLTKSHSFSAASLHDMSGLLLSPVAGGINCTATASSPSHSSKLRRSASFTGSEEVLRGQSLSSKAGNAVFHSPQLSVSPTNAPPEQIGSLRENNIDLDASYSKWQSLANEFGDGFSSAQFPVHLSGPCLDPVNESEGFMGTLLPNVTAVVLYAITRDHFSQQNLQELQELRNHSPCCPVLFLHVPPLLTALHSVPPEQHLSVLASYGVLRYPAPTLAPPPDQQSSAKANRPPKSPKSKRSAVFMRFGPSDEAPQQESAAVVAASTAGPSGEVTKTLDTDTTAAVAGTTATADTAAATAASPTGLFAPASHLGDPLVFLMDHTPKEEAVKLKPIKGKTVKFTSDVKDEKNEKKTLTRTLSGGRSGEKGRKEKELIIAGNCTDVFTEEEALSIKEKTIDLYRISHKLLQERVEDKSDHVDMTMLTEPRSDTNNATSVEQCQSLAELNDEQSERDWCKIPDNVMRILTDEFGFFKSSRNNTSPYHLRHGHINREPLGYTEQAMNPFVNAYNRSNVAAGGGDGDHDSNSGDSMAASDDASLRASDDLSGGSSGSDQVQLTKQKPADQCSDLCVGCEVMETLLEFNRLRDWTKRILRGHLAYTSQLLSKVQSRCLSSFVVFAFEFTRQLQITPRRLTYVRQQEEALCQAMVAAANDREEYIRQLIASTLHNETNEILKMAESFPLQVPNEGSSGDVCDGGGATPELSGHNAAWCETVLQEFVLKEINRRVGKKLLSGVQELRDNCLGTLKRCLARLELDCKLGGELPSVTHALQKMVNAAYQVEVRPTSSWGLLRSVWERVKALLSGGSGAGDAGSRERRPVPGSKSWKRQVAADMIKGLSERRLARTIGAQVCSEIKAAHAMFLSNLELLEHELNCTLANTEQQQRQLRAVHAPKLARLALHTDALNNRVNYGLPDLRGELGRGHFGVVYSCLGWGRYSPCAVKTLLPRDSTQWKDIAMQYHYTRLMGHHERIVSIHACLIDKYYGEASRPGRPRSAGGVRVGGAMSGSSNQCVLLVMDMHKCDLDTAIRRGLLWDQRFRIAIDVVQGIRFLHSQGLIHRDIKPKNVLIDGKGRAKVTDLDFCKPEAMMTGSVVGTPIHMAPELFTGDYDSSVDVYAFGVLFWYLCSGKTNMPRNFCLQKSKEDLKNAVFQGVRPECLITFSPECWSLMEQCWAPEPRERVLLGIVEERLTAMLDKCYRDMEEEDSSQYHNAQSSVDGSEDDDDDDSENDSYSSASDESDQEVLQRLSNAPPLPPGRRVLQGQHSASATQARRSTAAPHGGFSSAAGASNPPTRGAR